MARYHVGLDAGKYKHHACVRDTLTDQYSKVFPFSVNRQGFEGFVSFLERATVKGDTIVGVEASGPYAATIVHFLLEHGYTTVEINPFQAASFESLRGRKLRQIE